LSETLEPLHSLMIEMDDLEAFNTREFTPIKGNRMGRYRTISFR
jgi:hypothetical protein